MTAEPGHQTEVGSIDVNDLMDLLAARKPVLMRSSGDRAGPGRLAWDDYIKLVATSAYPPKRLRVTQRNGDPVPDVFIRDNNGVKPAALDQVIDAGGSVIAYGIEPYAPAIGPFCDALAQQLGEKVEAGVIATSGPGGALKIHYDITDVLVIQIEGRKGWVVYDNPALNPMPGMPEAPPAPKPDDPKLLETVLEAGDCLFVPAGHWHHCNNLAERSLHIAVLFFPLSEARVIDVLYRDALKSAEARAPVRGAGTGRADAIEAVKARLIERISALSEDDLVPRHLVTRVAGQNR